MKKILRTSFKQSLLFLFLTILGVSVAYAHHTGAMYDRAKTLVLEGTVKEFLYTNPHCWIVILTDDGEGNQVEWGFEASAPGRLKKFGLTPDKLKSGDKVTVTTHPLRDGRNGGAFVSIVLADGTLVDTASNSAPGYDEAKAKETAKPASATVIEKANEVKSENASSSNINIGLIILGLLVILGLALLLLRSKKK